MKRPRRRCSALEPLETRRLLSATQLVRNGGFEGVVAPADWTLSGNFQADSRFTNFHSGAGYAYLSGLDGNAANSVSGSMYQTLTIPSVANSLTLSFWRKITTSETTTTLANDTMSVSVMDSTGTNTLQSVTTLSNLNFSTSYVQQSFAINRSLMGQTVRLVFNASTNASLATTFRVDDVSLNVVAAATTNRVVGYMPEYRYTSFSKVDLSAVTHLNYFQISAATDGTLQTGGATASHLDTVVAAAHAAGVTVSITVGPISFSTLAADATARTTFATNVVNYALAHNLDGIDIDWEPPAGNNYTNYGLLIDALYSAGHSQHMILTAAVNPYTNEIPKAQVNAEMDWLNIMCYDFSYANHSTYTDAVAGMTDWTNYGVTKNKLVMGVPFYGRQGTSWSDTTTTSYTSITSGSLSATGAYPAPDVDFAQNSYFNGPETIRKKTQYVASNGFGGMMIWEHGMDHWNASGQTDPWSLLPVIKSVMMPSTGITSVATSPADNAYAPLNQNQTVAVTVTMNVASAGVMQASLISDTTARDWFYVSAPGVVTHTFNIPTTDAVTGTEFYEIYTQFRAGATTGPYTDVAASDLLKLTPYHLNWQQFPATPSTPTPADNVVLAAQPSLLDWADTPSATSYDVYVDGTLRQNVTTSQWTRNITLASNVTHTWQVIARNTYGTTTGPTWHFNIDPPPTIQSATFDVNTRKITVTASEALSSPASSNASITLGANTTDLGLGVVSGSTVAYTIPMNLPDGTYTLRIPAGAIRDGAGNGLASDWTWNTWFMAGDANRDQHVDSADFTMLSNGFNQPGMNFSQGDFNYDGKVNALDFNVLASRYGATASAPLSADVSVLGTTVPNLFSAQRIQPDSLGVI